MGIPILNHLLPQGLLVELVVQPLFVKNLHVPSVLDIVAILLDPHPILTRSLLDMFSAYQVFHQTTLQIFVIILAIHYVVSLLNFDTGFP